MQRIAVVVNNLGPYHIARLSAASRLCELLAVEVSACSHEYAWNAAGIVPFHRETLFGPNATTRDIRKGYLARLDEVLGRFEPSALAIPGWHGVDGLGSLRWAVQHSIPTVVMSETQESDRRRPPLREWIKRRLARHMQAALVGGTPHRQYMESLGIRREKITMGYDAVDNLYFSRGAELARRNGPALRSAFGLPELYFVASSRFIPKKNLFRLIRAYADYRQTLLNDGRPPHEIWHLVILGDGDLRPDVEQFRSDLSLRDYVHLPGFLQYDALPAYYGLAGAFVHASTTEQWGLVVNEAMASGLPVIVSDRCGCAADLVEDGWNGMTFDPLNTRQLTDAMLRLSSQDTDRKLMGLASQEIVAHWSPERFARGLIEGAQIASNSSRHPHTFVDRALLRLLMAR